jgi:hypothetical protein
MAASAWHTRMFHATEYWSKGQYSDCFLALSSALLIWRDTPEEWGEYMDNEAYNCWLDLVDILRLVGRWPVLELSSFYVDNVEALAAAVANFEAVETNNLASFAQLEKAINADIYWILEGLKLAADYCFRQEIDFDGEEKLLSFELLQGGKIRFYGYSDRPETEEEIAEEAETIAYLRDDFNSLFLAPFMDEKKTVLQQARDFMSAKNYAAALPQFALACREQGAEQKTIFLEMYEAHHRLQQWRAAADVLMKAYLLGLHKSQIRKQIIEVCKQMLSQAAVQNSEDEKARWLRLQDDFS